MRPCPIVIVLADDDADDRMIARDALTESRVANDLRTVAGGAELLDYLWHRGKYRDRAAHPRPGLILLDLGMPGVGGREALREIKADPELRQIPVAVLTTSKAEEDTFRAHDLGVSAFLSKPVTFDGIVGVMKTLGRYWIEIVELPPEPSTPQD